MSASASSPSPSDRGFLDTARARLRPAARADSSAAMTDITHVILDLDGTLINTGARRADRPFPSAPGRPGVVRSSAVPTCALASPRSRLPALSPPRALASRRPPTPDVLPPAPSRATRRRGGLRGDPRVRRLRPRDGPRCGGGRARDAPPGRLPGPDRPPGPPVASGRGRRRRRRPPRPGAHHPRGAPRRDRGPPRRAVARGVHDARREAPPGPPPRARRPRRARHQHPERLPRAQDENARRMGRPPARPMHGRRGGAGQTRAGHLPPRRRAPRRGPRAVPRRRGHAARRRRRESRRDAMRRRAEHPEKTRDALRRRRRDRALAVRPRPRAIRPAPLRRLDPEPARGSSRGGGARAAPETRRSHARPRGEGVRARVQAARHTDGQPGRGGAQERERRVGAGDILRVGERRTAARDRRDDGR